jgi:hypothetical protein
MIGRTRKRKKSRGKIAMRLWVRWVLFGSSYTPFFLILLLRDRFAAPLFSWLLVALVVLSNLVLALLLRKNDRINPDRSGTVASVDLKTGDALNYIVTYVIPFLELKTPEDLLPLLILMAVVGILYVNSNLLYTNPMLSFFGFRVYEVKLQGEEQPLILMTRKGRPAIHASVKAVLLTEDLYQER